MTGILRHPQGIVQAGGNTFPFKELKVTQTRTKKGDTFSATGALSLVNLGYYLSTTPIPITVSINGTQIFTGLVDHVDGDFDTNTICISGRDNVSKMIDTQTSEKFLNQKPSDIVNTIAQRHGIPVSMDTPSDDAGKMYSTDFDAISHRYSEWSLISKIADHYGMIAYMTNGTLYFKNFDEQLPSRTLNYTPPSERQPAEANFMKLKFSRSLVLGKPIKINVHSHHHKQKQVYSATASGNSGGSGDTLVYNHTIPGISQSQCQTIANSKLAEVQSHELTLDELEMRGDETINARMSFDLTGTGTALDQSYDANSIDHVIGFDGGYKTGIRVKNKRKGGERLMIIDFLEVIRREIDRALAGTNHMMVGFVDSYNPNDHTAKIKFPTELDANGNPRISGWIPHAVTAGGAASWVVGPNTGDQCIVGHLEGDSESPIILGYLHNVVDTPPSAASSQGFLRHTSTGNYFTLGTDGSFQHFHKSTGNYGKMDKNGNFVTYIADPTKTQHYIGGDPSKGSPVFAAVSTAAGPSPYAQARIS